MIGFAPWLWLLLAPAGGRRRAWVLALLASAIVLGQVFSLDLARPGPASAWGPWPIAAPPAVLPAAALLLPCALAAARRLSPADATSAGLALLALLLTGQDQGVAALAAAMAMGSTSRAALALILLSLAAPDWTRPAALAVALFAEDEAEDPAAPARAVALLALLLESATPQPALAALLALPAVLRPGLASLGPLCALAPAPPAAALLLAAAALGRSGPGGAALGVTPGAPGFVAGLWMLAAAPPGALGVVALALAAPLAGWRLPRLPEARARLALALALGLWPQLIAQLGLQVGWAP